MGFENNAAAQNSDETITRTVETKVAVERTGFFKNFSKGLGIGVATGTVTAAAGIGIYNYNKHGSVLPQGLSSNDAGEAAQAAASFIGGLLR